MPALRSTHRRAMGAGRPATLLTAFLIPIAVTGCNPAGPRATKSTGAAQQVFVNPAQARTYAGIDLIVARDPETAVSVIQDIQKADPGNAMNDYLLAAVYARKRDWKAAAREMEAGNAAPRCVHYQLDSGPLRSYTALAPVRGLATDCLGAARTMSRDSGEAMIRDVRAMAKRIAGTEPNAALPLMAAVNIRVLADRALTELRSDKGGDVAEAERIGQADRAWGRTAGMAVQGVFGRAYATRLTQLMAQHGVTDSESRALTNGDPLPAASRAKLAAVTADMDAQTAPGVLKAVADMPP